MYRDNKKTNCHRQHRLKMIMLKKMQSYDDYCLKIYTNALKCCTLVYWGIKISNGKIRVTPHMNLRIRQIEVTIMNVSSSNLNYSRLLVHNKLYSSKKCVPLLQH